MVLLRTFSCIVLLSTCLGCQISYIVRSGIEQTKILAQRESLDKTLRSSSVPESVKNKIRLAREAKVFAEEKLGLKATDNYSSYVDLERRYVSWIVQAAKEYELTPYLWKFPLVGELPYKGFFTEDGARKEAASFDESEYDTYVRGVTAYSTLGWFDDPLLNTMMNYSDADLVELIIHESVHATLYIKSEAEFNERLATYIGQLGAEKFFLQKEGEDSATLKAIQQERDDRKIFSNFISHEIQELEKWYKDHEGQVKPKEKEERLKQIQSRFAEDVWPKLKTTALNDALTGNLNNAVLVSLKTYQKDLDDFEQLYKKLNKDIGAMLDFCKELENEDDPAQKLKDFLKPSDSTAALDVPHPPSTHTRA